MSDWEIEDNQVNQSAQPESDWSIVEDTVPSTPEKSLGSHIVTAASNLGEDVIKGGFNTLKNIPNYYHSAVSSVPEIYKAIKENPSGAAKQGLAGVAELGQNIFNTPYDIANYAANRLDLIPQDVNKKIQMARMPDSENEINELLGTPKNAGEEDLRWTGRNSLNLLGGAGVTKALNPMQLTSKNIAKNIVKTEKKMKEKYSGPNGLYNKLSDEASARGITGQNISPNSNDLSILQKDMPEDEFVAINKLLQNKNTTNAQNAISQLGFRQRKLESKFNRGDILTDPEKDLLKAVKSTKNHIQENMFMDNTGKVHEDLLNKHKKIQQGYANEVIPYTKNPAIQAFKKNEKMAGELVNSLSRGKFAAKRGSAHPAIGIRNKLTPSWNKLGLAGLAKILYDNMMGEPPSNTNKLGQ